MKIFKNKFLVKLIAFMCLFLAILNFSGANKAYAVDEVEGSVILKPVINLLTGIADAIMNVLHTEIMHQSTSMIKISGDTNWGRFWKTCGVIVLSILAAVAFITIVTAITGIAGTAIATAVGKTFTIASIATTITYGSIGGIVVGTFTGIRLANEWLPDDILLPSFTLSAEEIFSNRILLFDVNFFNPMESEPIIEQVPAEPTSLENIKKHYESLQDIPANEWINTNKDAWWDEYAYENMEIDADTIPIPEFNRFGNLVFVLRSVYPNYTERSVNDIYRIILSERDLYEQERENLQEGEGKEEEQKRCEEAIKKCEEAIGQLEDLLENFWGLGEQGENYNNNDPLLSIRFETGHSEGNYQEFNGSRRKI